MSETLTRAKISNQLSDKIGLSRFKANVILEDILELMIKGLVDDGYLKLSSFGSFTVSHKNERIGRNPKTGIEAIISSRKTVSFKPSNTLKEYVMKSSNNIGSVK